MKLVIDIDDNEYMSIKEYPNNITSYPVTIHIYDAIRNGEAFAKRYEWIPVSERLPENYQRVLVTIVNYYGHKVVRVAEYFDENKEFQIKENEEHWNVGEKGLLAWTPLPEAYKEEEK